MKNCINLCMTDLKLPELNNIPKEISQQHYINSFYVPCFFSVRISEITLLEFVTVTKDKI